MECGEGASSSIPLGATLLLSQPYQLQYRKEGGGYCKLRSSTCFIHGSLHSARIFLLESFKQNLNTNFFGVKKKEKSSGNFTAKHSRHQLPPALSVCTETTLPLEQTRSFWALVSLTNRAARWPRWLVGPSQNSWWLPLFPLQLCNRLNSDRFFKTTI